MLEICLRYPRDIPEICLRYTGRFKKNALIENRFKNTNSDAGLCWKCIFSYNKLLLWHGKYISMFRFMFYGRFKCISQEFWGFFKVLSWVFSEGFKYMGVVRQGCLRIFLWKKGLVLCTKVMVATHASSIEQKHP